MYVLRDVVKLEIRNACNVPYTVKHAYSEHTHINEQALRISDFLFPMGLTKAYCED